MIQPSAVFSKSMYIVTGKPSETLKNNSTGEPEVTLKNNRAGEPSGKSKDDTGDTFRYNCGGHCTSCTKKNPEKPT